MRKNLLSFISGIFVCAMFFMLSSTTSAATPKTPIKAELNKEIKIMVNGKTFTAKNSKGKTMYPITYLGTTYVPVCPLADTLNITNEWEKKTATLWLGGKNKEVAVTDAEQYKDYYGTVITQNAKLLTTSEKTYEWGITNEEPLELAYFGCYVSPMNKYKKFTASVYLDAGVQKDLLIEIRKNTYDGEVIKSYMLSPGKYTDIDIDISGIKKMYLIANIKSDHGKVNKMVIGEPMFKN